MAPFRLPQIAHFSLYNDTQLVVLQAIEALHHICLEDGSKMLRIDITLRTPNSNNKYK